MDLSTTPPPHPPPSNHQQQHNPNPGQSTTTTNNGATTSLNTNIPPAPGYSSPSRPPKKSATTCTTCRARKVRCNGVRPLCSNCQRLGFPCSYDDDSTDPAAAAAAWSMALPRRRVKQACLSCHSRKARCSGHMPSCDRCRAQGLECVYRPTKRARVSTKSLSGGRSPQSHDEDGRDDGQGDSDPGFLDTTRATTPNNFNGDMYGAAPRMPTMAMDSGHQAPPYHSPLPDESFDALVGRTFDKFFRHVHHIPMFSFLHRASLMEQYHTGKVDKSLLLALVGITSVLTDMGRGMIEYGERCITEAEHLILSDFARPSTFKVQALVFMIKHRILSNRFPNAFVLLSLASRFAFALRLNFDSPQVCFLAQESRRRLVWSLYCIDAGISSGNRDYSLWRAERVFVGLPCNERNFEFDLPQETEKLIPESNEPRSEQAEDIGSLALHIRIQHIRKKINEFAKEVKESLDTRPVRPSDLQTRVLSLHGELEDFAGHLPVSFQFSENSLRLRAYSPRICVFIMIHVWWRQCHCDLYRLGLIGLREALPTNELSKFDESFIKHCQRQCVDHSIAMASIFSSMQRLGAKPVADLDLGFCAYHCARMLRYAYHANSGNLNLSSDTIMEHLRACLQVVKECCSGAASEGIRRDIEVIISQGLGARTSPSRTTSPPPQPNRHSRNRNGFGHSISRQNNASTNSNGNTSNQNAAVLRDVDMPPEDTAMESPPSATLSAGLNRDGSAANGNFASNPTPISNPALPQPMISGDPWPGDAQIPADLVSSKGTPQQSQPQDDFPSAGAPSELNSAYEGAVDNLGLDNGIDYAMGIDMNMWTPGQSTAAPAGSDAEWTNTDFMHGTGVGV